MQTDWSGGSFPWPQSFCSSRCRWRPKTYVTGVLDHIEVTKWPHSCYDNITDHQTYPPAATFRVSLSGSCKNSSTTLDLSLNIQQTTSKAEVINSAQVRFESGLPSSISATATYTIPNSLIQTLGIYFPAEDMDPSSGYKEANGTCVAVETKGGKKQAHGAPTATAADCVRNRDQYVSLADDGAKYYIADTEVATNLLNAGTSEAEGMGLIANVRLWYKMSPPNKVTITSTTPAAGERQDPNGDFSFDAKVTSELNSDDDGNVILRLYQADGSLVVESVSAQASNAAPVRSRSRLPGRTCPGCFAGSPQSGSVPADRGPAGQERPDTGAVRPR